MSRGKRPGVQFYARDTRAAIRSRDAGIDLTDFLFFYALSVCICLTLCVFVSVYVCLRERGH